MAANKTLADSLVQMGVENAYLKKALNIKNPIRRATSTNVDYNLISCLGNRTDQTVTLMFILTNKAANEEVKFLSTDAIDPEGISYKTSKINAVGGQLYRAALLPTDVPVRFQIKFDKILPEVSVLKFVILKSAKFGVKPVEFRNIPVKWN